MKVLAFSAYYTPEIAASMYLTEDIYKGIVDAGHTLEVYVPTPTRGIDQEVRNKYKHKKHIKKYGGKMVLHRISMFGENKNTLMRALRYLLINAAFIWKGLWTKADVIFVQSTPPTQGMMAAIIGIIKRIPVVYNLQDIFPDSLINTGMTKEGSLIWKIGRIVEDFTYKHSKKIIVISDDFKKNIIKKGVPENKIVVVPNWADIGGVHPIDRKENILIKRYDLDPNKFYITYCGNIGYTQNMDLLLDVANALKEEIRDLSFVLIGDGADKERVAKRISEEQINNVIMLPFQPYKDIAHVFSLGDVGLIISKSGVGNNSVPSKTWSYLAAGKPILASFDSESELSQLINTYCLGVQVDADEKDALITSVKKLYFSDCYEIGKRGIGYIGSYSQKNNCVNIYVKTIASCKKGKIS